MVLGCDILYGSYMIWSKLSVFYRKWGTNEGRNFTENPFYIESLLYMQSSPRISDNHKIENKKNNFLLLAEVCLVYWFIWVFSKIALKLYLITQQFCRNFGNESVYSTFSCFSSDFVTEQPPFLTTMLMTAQQYVIANVDAIEKNSEKNLSSC